MSAWHYCDVAESGRVWCDTCHMTTSQALLGRFISIYCTQHCTALYNSPPHPDIYCSSLYVSNPSSLCLCAIVYLLCETATAIGPVACILVTNRTNTPELGLGKIMMLYYLDQDKAPILQQYFPSGRCIFVEMMEAERTRYFYFYTTTIHTNTVIHSFNNNNNNHLLLPPFVSNNSWD